MKRKHKQQLEECIDRLSKYIEYGALLASTDFVEFFNAIEEKLKNPLDADFLARQIVDDLFRAGIDARFQQHIVEQTIRGWLAGSGRSWGK